MPLTSTVAKQLCTEAELKLFTESLARNVKKLNLKAVKARVDRSRRLRNKYSDLADRQDREMRGKREARRRRTVRGNENTRKKEQLFSEALARFEQHRIALESASANTNKAAKRTKRASITAATTRSTTTKKKTGAGTQRKASKRKRGAKSAKKTNVTGKTSEATAKAKQSRFTAAGQMRIHKHVSAQNRRRQAKRDSR